MSDERFNESIMTHGWPECGAGRIDIEELYQMFKERLIAELYARRTIPPNFIERLPLESLPDNGN